MSHSGALDLTPFSEEMQVTGARDLHNEIEVRRLISPQVQTNADTAFVSQIIDTQGFEVLEIIIALGAITDADVTFVPLLEHGDASNLSDAAAVPDSMMIGTETTADFSFADDNEVRKLGYKAATGKRYVRLTITPSGNGAGDINIAAVAVLFGAHRTATLTQADD